MLIFENELHIPARLVAWCIFIVRLKATLGSGFLSPRFLLRNARRLLPFVPCRRISDFTNRAADAAGSGLLVSCLDVEELLKEKDVLESGREDYLTTDSISIGIGEDTGLRRSSKCSHLEDDLIDLIIGNI